MWEGTEHRPMDRWGKNVTWTDLWLITLFQGWLLFTLRLLRPRFSNMFTYCSNKHICQHGIYSVGWISCDGNNMWLQSSALERLQVHLSLSNVINYCLCTIKRILMRIELTNMKRSVGRVTIASMKITLTSRNQGVQSQLNASPRLNRNKRETSTSGRLRGLRVSWVYALFSWNATESSHVVNISRLQL